MTPEQVSSYLVTAVEITRRTTMTRGMFLGAAAVLAALGIAVAMSRTQAAQQTVTPAHQGAQQPGTTLHQDAFGRWLDEYGRIVG